MAGVCVEKIPHQCTPQHLSQGGLQVFYDEETDSYNGYCFSCNTFVPDPYGDKPAGYKPKPNIKTQEEIQAELDEILDCPTLALPSRGLKKEYLEYFDIKIGLSEADGKTPAIRYYPYYKDGVLVKYKAKLIDKKSMWSVGTEKDIDLFGWEQAKQSGGKRLLITEGEDDTVALFQMIKEGNKGGKWADLNPAVVSIPNGAASAERDVSRVLKDILPRFEEFVFVRDMDEAGKRAADALSKLIPDLKIAEVPDKDPNACLLNGKSKMCVRSVLFNAQKQKNTRIIHGSSLRQLAKKRPEQGLSWPWDGLTEATRGIRRGETYYLGAGVKMGKSEVVNAIAAHMMIEHQTPVFLVKPEEAIGKTYQMLVGKAAKRIFHDPNIPFDEEAFDAAEPLIGDKALIQDVYQFVDWDTLKQDIHYVVKSEGVRDIILDPITCFTNQMDISSANEFLVGMSAELSAMSKDLGFTSYMFCHLNPPKQGLPHERGGNVLSSQFTGSRAMMRSCNLMIGIEGNKDPELPEEERNIRTLSILEDREYGSSARVRLFWDKNTGEFRELEG